LKRKPEIDKFNRKPNYFGYKKNSLLIKTAGGQLSQVNIHYDLVTNSKSLGFYFNYLTKVESKKIDIMIREVVSKVAED